MPHELLHHQGYILGGLTYRIEALEEASAKTRKDVDMLKTWALRVAILVTLWAAGLASHLSREQTSDLLAAVVKAALRL